MCLDSLANKDYWDVSSSATCGAGGGGVVGEEGAFSLELSALFCVCDVIATIGSGAETSEAGEVGLLRSSAC